MSNQIFSGCNSLLSIDIPKNVKEISSSTFDGCSNLKEINVSRENPFFYSIYGILYDKDTVNLIKCPGGKQGNVSIPETVNYISENAFGNCGEIKNISIPSSIVNIGESAFANCGSLLSLDVSPENRYYSSFDGILYNKDQTVLIQCPGGKNEVHLPENLITIESRAFSYCKNIQELITPNSTQNIGIHAFSNCESLTSIILSESLETIEYGLFSYCTSLKQVVIPNSVTNIENDAFDMCYALEYLELPSLLKYLGDSVFFNCNSLKSLKLPDSVKEVGRLVLHSCQSVTLLDLPASISEYQSIVYGCHDFETLILRALIPPTFSLYPISYGSYETHVDPILYVYRECIDEYKNSSWAEYFVDIMAIEDLEIPADEIQIYGYNGTPVSVGSTIQLTATVFPEDATTESLLWSSSNEEVATVNDKGLVKAISEGTATISVCLSNNQDINASVDITVEGDAGIESLIDDNSEVKVYNLNGMIVLKTRNKEEFHTLPSGQYIINGKKVMISR